MDSQERTQLLLGIELESARLRGTFIHSFTEIESLIDSINRNNMFGDGRTFDFYMKLMEKEDFSFNIKVKIFDFCVRRFEHLHTKDMADVKREIAVLIKHRNALAHWRVDVSKSGYELFKEKQQIRLVKLKMGVKTQELVYDKNIIEQLLESINIVRKGALIIHKATRDSREYSE